MSAALNTKNKQNKTSTIDPAEVAKFSAMAAEWWDLSGKFKPLHKLNPVRLDYIRAHATSHFNIDKNARHPLAGLKLLDIGCGGGLLCEPMTRLGAQVTGIDASGINIKIAGQHAEEQSLDINYQCITAEDLVGKRQKFDIILNMEVIEHVANVPLFLEAGTKLLKPGGLLFMATLNRTLKSYALAIIGAEYVLGWLPKGTHRWEKFITPDELAQMLEQTGLTITDRAGATYNPLADKWNLSHNTDVNYMLAATKGE